MSEPTVRTGPEPTPAPAGRHPAAVPAPGHPDPDAISTVVLGCLDVLGLSGGQYGEVATYLPGRRVTGVRITDSQVSVHVVARYGPPLREVSARIHRMLGPLTGGLPVEVVIDDIARD